MAVVFGSAEEALSEPKAKGYSIERPDLNNTFSQITVTQKQSNEPLKMQGWSDKANMEKAP